MLFKIKKYFPQISQFFADQLQNLRQSARSAGKEEYHPNLLFLQLKIILT
jgi:hypothetical protein